MIATRPVRHRVPAVPLRRGAPVALALAGAAAWLIASPESVDLAAHVYRAKAPLSLWDGNWYGGHHTLAYSVLFPPLGWLVGVRLAGALSAVAAAALFEPLARDRYGERALPGSLFFAAGTTATLLNGRLTFLLGVAIGLAALLVFTRGRTGFGALAAVACGLASPVAAAFLALAALALALTRHRRALALLAAAIVPPLLLVVAFPEGGFEPFAASAFWPLPVLSLAAVLVLPRRERAVRTGALLYALAGSAAFVVHTPFGSNAVRLGTLFGGPVLACAAASRRRLVVSVAVIAGFAWWMAGPAVTDVSKVAGDPAATAAYYRPLVSLLDRAAGPPARVEIPFTRAHWEAAYVAPRFPLARGWERQLDIARNPLFYGRAPLTSATYRAWLSANAVRYVAVPDATLDYAATAEAALIRSGLPYLAPRWRTRHWQVYEFLGPSGFVVPTGAARVRALRVGRESVVVSVSHPGAAVVRVAWSPYWRLAGGCVERAGQWTRVDMPRAGTFTLAISFDLLRVVERGRRCD